MKIEWNEIEDYEIDGVDTRDYPEFCDAFIASAVYKGREATDEELDAMNEDWDDYMTPRHELAFESLL